MQTTPVKKGRGVLMELPNGRDLSSPAKGEIKAEDGSGTAVVLEKKHPQIQVSVIPSGRPPLYCSPAIRRRSSLATNKPKRIRQSPSAKRVSFGGDTINIISQHPKEFRSPDADTPPGSVLSPSHKSRKLSHPSSPAARRSPAFVSKKTSLFGGSDGDDDTITLPARLRASPRPGPSLTPLPRLKSRATQREGPSLNSLLSGDVEDDDTVNLPKEPRVSLNRVSASMSRPPLPMTSPSPVPLRRSSVANVRHSFGIFLDDDISRGQGDAALTDENDPPEFNEGVLSDGNEAEASDEDITRDLRIGMAIDKLLDSDESASADVATENESEHSVLPTVSPPAERPSQPSSRQSLGYISELPPLQDDCGGDDDITQRRCSMAPAVGHRAVIEDDSRSKRFSVHSAVQMGDILHQIEQDEQDDDVTIHFPSAQQQMTEPERSPVAYAVETIEHDKSGKSGKEDALKQYQVGEEETEDRADAIQRDAVSASVRDTDVTSQAVSPHESEVIPGALSPRNECNKELSEDLVDRRTTSENHIKSSPSCNIAQPSSRSPLKEQRKLFESDDTETLHFHSTNPNQKKTSASDNSPAKAKNGINAAKGVDQVSNGVETSSADDNKPPVEKMSDSSRAANAAIQDRDTLEPPTTNTMVTPRSETGKRVRACVSEKFLPNSTTKVSTPLSAPGSKIRSSMLERSASQRKSGRDSKVDELSVSEMKPSAAKAAKQQDLFSMADFLGSCNLRFEDHRIQCIREPSFSPEVLSSDVDKASAEWRMLHFTKKEKYLSHLQIQVRKQKELFSSTVERISALESDILRQHPPVYSFMSKNNSREGKEVANCRVGLKRLRKACHFKNRLDWVLSRQKWESDIRNGLEESAEACEADVTTLRAMEKAITSRTANLAEALASLNFKQDSQVPDVPGDVIMKREQIASDLAYNSEVRGLISSNIASQTQDAEESEMLLPKKDQLISQLRDLELYAGAQADRKLKLKVREGKERNLLLCEIAGFRPKEISTVAISGALGDLMNIEVTMSGDDVESVQVHPIDSWSGSGAFLEAYVQGAVSLSRDQLMTIQAVREVPFALHCSAKKLLYAKNFMDDVTEYFESHIGEASGANVVEGQLPSLDVSLVGSFYSLTEWTKFDVAVTISTYFSSKMAVSPYQEVKEIAVRRFIGDAPSDDVIREAFIVSGFRKNARTLSVCEAFSGVWKLL